MWLGNEALYINNSVCLGQPNYATTRSLQTQLHNWVIQYELNYG